MQQSKENLLGTGDGEPKEKEGCCPWNFFSTRQSKAKLTLPTEDSEDNTVVTQPAAHGERASGGGMSPG